MTGPLPDDAITAAAEAIHVIRIEKGASPGPVCSCHDIRMATAALTAALPALTDAAAAHAAEADFLAASVAVWREIDRLDDEPDGYHPIRMSVDLRKAERAAWERYRDLLDGTADGAHTPGGAT